MPIDVADVRAVLERLHDEGRTYVKSRHVAAELGESAHAVGWAMHDLEQRGVVERRADTSNIVTWRITLGEGDDA